MSKIERILVVDDEQRIRDTFRLALETEGYEVATAASGEEALAAVREQGPWNLLLLDHAMPGMTGIDALHRLREEGDAPPAILMTAYDALAIPKAASREGVSAFLHKPVTPDQLREVVEEVLERYRKPGGEE